MISSIALFKKKISTGWNQFTAWLQQRPLIGSGKLYILSSLIGLIVGGFVILLNFAVIDSRSLFLSSWCGFYPPIPLSPYQHAFTPVAHPVLLLFIPALGGLLMGYLAEKFCPDCFGGGTDRVIKSFHQERGEIDKKVSFFKILTTALTVGSGGSAGNEGPSQYVGASIGSTLARWLKLNDSDRRTLLTAGAAAGLGAIFKAPLGGALFACEIYYSQPEFETQAVVPSLIASVISFSVFSLVFGTTPLWFIHFHLIFNISDLIPLTVLALITGTFSLVFVYILEWVEKELSMIPKIFRPALGGLGVGIVLLIGYFVLGVHQFVGILSEGYGTVQQAIDGHLAISVLILLAIGKILATSLTLGSGGSGGFFAPAMVMGGCLGGAVGGISFLLFPHLVQSPEAYIVLGIGAFLAGISRAPISTIIMMTEVAQSYNVLLPLIWVCSIAYLISYRECLFKNQFAKQSDSPAHRNDLVRDILKNIPITKLLEKNFKPVVCFPDTSLTEILEKTKKSHQLIIPIIHPQTKKLVSIISRKTIQNSLSQFTNPELILATNLQQNNYPVLHEYQNLDDALTALSQSDLEELPIVGNFNKFSGLANRIELIQVYTEETLKYQTQVSSVSHNA
jgi:CIC family chloride channel protein